MVSAPLTCVQELVYFDLGMCGVVSASMLVVITAIGQYHRDNTVSEEISIITLLLLILFIAEVIDCAVCVFPFVVPLLLTPSRTPPLPLRRSA